MKAVIFLVCIAIFYFLFVREWMNNGLEKACEILKNIFNPDQAQT